MLIATTPQGRKQWIVVTVQMATYRGSREVAC